MGPIEFNCPNFGQLKVIGDRLYESHHFVVQSNIDSTTFDYLIFLDSRGISAEFDSSIAAKLIAKIQQTGKTYLMVCRPLELTIWATLIGFLAINQLNPAKIITNMGFVDFTPKKLSILSDATQQVELSVGKDVVKPYFVEDFSLSSGETVALFAMNYGKAYRNAIEAISVIHKMIIINTPLTDAGIAIERKRPASFFLAQSESNNFNRSINGAQVIDFQKFDELLTYDAVHYTPRGNEVIFDAVKGFI
jgi:hypothetical protein